MKIIFAFVSFLVMTFGQRADVPYQELETSFLKKDAEAISKMGSNKLMISLFGKENVYSNQQASLVLKDFFDEYPVTGFKFIFKGRENSEGSFAIANYTTKTANLRITFNFKKTESVYRIVRLNIEKE